MISKIVTVAPGEHWLKATLYLGDDRRFLAPSGPYLFRSHEPLGLGADVPKVAAIALRIVSA